MPRNPYTPSWRDRVRDGAQSSMEVLAEEITDVLGGPESVIDVGCGEAWLGHSLRLVSPQTRYLGVDGPWAEKADVTIDLATEPEYPDMGVRWDLAVSLETAEHVPAARSADLVGWLCSLAPVVLFSAAAPGQGGEGHVNEQWPGYWADLFADRGYDGTGQMRWRIWEDDRVCWWYRQNLLLFVDPEQAPYPMAHLVTDGWRDGCPPVIHPGAWAHKGHG